MNEEIIEQVKSVEEKLASGQSIERDDILFLFGLSLLKDHTNETE